MTITRVAPSLIAVANNLTNTTLGSANTIPNLTFDGSGIISTGSNTAVAINTADIVNGAVTNQKLAGSITGDKLAANTIGSSNLTTTGVVAGVYGGSSQMPVVTVDAQGRVTSAANTTYFTGFNGATINPVSQTALTLSNTSTQYQRVQINVAANSVVTLPNAQTMSVEGSYPFVIENRGLRNQNLLIKNHGGENIGFTAISQKTVCSLVDNSTANGIWTTTQDSIDHLIVADESSLTSTTLTAGADGQTGGSKLIGLTTTKFVVCYATFNSSNSQYTIRTLIGDISGSTITYGSEQVSSAFSPGTAGTSGAQSASLRIYRLSDSAFVILLGLHVSENVPCVGDRQYARSYVLTCTVSGTTVTYGSASQLSLPTVGGTVGAGQAARACAYNGDFVRMSDTKFAIFYNTATTASYDWPKNYSGSLGCNIITVSGTTQTIGTRVDLGTSTYTQILGLGCYDTDKILVCYSQASAGSSIGRSKLVVVTVSGTTPTWNTPINIQSSDSECLTNSVDNRGFLYSINTAKCFVPYIDTTSKVAFVSISTTTPSVDFSTLGVGLLSPTVPIISSNLISFFIYISADGFYSATGGTSTIGNVQQNKAALPDNTKNLVTTNGSGASGTLITALATAAFNS